MRGASERGAAAVEFALVAMLLVALMMGILEFGRLWAIQGNLAQAARDAARTAAITDSGEAGEAKFDEVFQPIAATDPATDKTPVQVGTPGEEDCLWTVEPKFTTGSLTGFFGTDNWTITARGAMRCNG